MFILLYLGQPRHIYGRMLGKGSRQVDCNRFNFETAAGVLKFLLTIWRFDPSLAPLDGKNTLLRLWLETNGTRQPRFPIVKRNWRGRERMRLTINIFWEIFHRRNNSHRMYKWTLIELQLCWCPRLACCVHSESISIINNHHHHLSRWYV